MFFHRVRAGSLGTAGLCLCLALATHASGSEGLLARPYDQVTFPTTHNAMSCRARHWLAPNQNHTIARQLEDGIRGLMLDIHEHEGQLYLAHGRVRWGKQPLVDGLAEIVGFLKRDPEAVVTLILESYGDPSAIERTFEEAGATPFVHAQPPGKPWPTLGAMVRSNRRLVVFTDRKGTGPPWLHPVWEYCWDTNWSAKAPADLSNRPDRGRPTNGLVILNNFLTRPVALPSLAEQVNQNPFLIDRVQAFRAEHGRYPNFIAVDFYDIGDLLAVCRRINGAP